MIVTAAVIEESGPRVSRSRIARELGATHTIDATTEDAVARIMAITAGGADYSLEATASPKVLRHAETGSVIKTVLVMAEAQ